MRTTLTLDDDVAAKLKLEAKRSSRSFREVVNDMLRRGLATRTRKPAQPFRIVVRDLGNARPGLNFDCISTLIDQIDGPLHR